MRPKERREGRQVDLFRSRLDQILNLEHALVKLAHKHGMKLCQSHARIGKLALIKHPRAICMPNSSSGPTRR